jgi:hypothetical protein
MHIEFFFNQYVPRGGLSLDKKPGVAPWAWERRLNGGYTMVEGIVASVISSMLIGVLFTILGFNYNSVKFGVVSAKVRSQYEIAITEIGTNTRNAYAVLNYEGSGESYPPASTLAQIVTSKIMMYGEDATGAGTTVRGFWVDDGQLKAIYRGQLVCDECPGRQPVPTLGRQKNHNRLDAGRRFALRGGRRRSCTGRSIHLQELNSVYTAIRQR